MSEEKKPIPEGAENFNFSEIEDTSRSDNERNLGSRFIDKLKGRLSETVNESEFSDKNLRNKIENLDKTSYIEFLDSFDFDKHQYDISQKTANTLLEKHLSLAESYPGYDPRKDYDGDMYAGDTFPFLIQHNRKLFPKNRIDLEKENVSDRLLKASIDMLKEHKHMVSMLGFYSFGMIEQGNKVSDSASLDALKESLWLPESEYEYYEKITINTLSSQLASLVLKQVIQSPNRFKENFTNLIDNPDVENIDLAKLIEVIDYVAHGFIGNDIQNYGLEMLLDLAKSIDNMSDNYLLSERSRRVVSDIDAVRAEEKTPRREVMEGVNSKQLAPGIIGVYNTQNNLEGFQYESRVNPDAIEDKVGVVHKISELELTVSKIRNMSIDHKNEMVQDFIFLESMSVKKDIEDDFGVTLSDLDIRTQNSFLNYIKSNTEDNVLQMAKASKKFGKDFFTSFLSLEQNANMSNVIFDIAQKNSHETASEIFKKYADLIGAVDNVRDYLRESFGDEFQNNPDLEGKIIDNLMEKGRDILISAASLSEGTDIERYLNNAKADVLLFYNTVKALRDQNRSVDLNEFKNIHLESLEGSQLTDEHKQQFLNMVETNWSNSGKEGQMVVADFIDLLSNEGRLDKTSFYLIEHNHDVLGFFRFDELEDGSLYFGSVNSRNDLQGARIGEKLLDDIFTTVAQNKLVRADCNPTSPITSKYINKFGFVGTNLTSYASSGDTFRIVRDDRENKLANTRNKLNQLDYQQLLDRKSQYSNNPLVSIISYTFPQKQSAFVREIANMLNNDPGTVITAYQQEKPHRADGSYGVVIGLEKLASNSYPLESLQPTETLTT